MAASQSPLTAAGGPRTDIFIGRRPELGQLVRLVAVAGPVAVVGPGGIGKSRLVQQMLASDVAAGRDAYIVDLGSLATPDLVAAAVASTIGLNPAAEDPLDVACRHLGVSDALLVLDTCEHLAAPVSALMTDLVHRCPRITVLATSRHVLDVPALRVLSIGPLPITHRRGARVVDGEAVDLFTARARAMDPAFDPSPGQSAIIRDICERLDGIPLAIELAAARTRALTVEQIQQRLDASIDLLARTSTSAPARQRSIRASVQWSFDLCTAEEQALWVEAAYFAGSFDIDAAEAVWHRDGSPHRSAVLDLVETLAEKSILTVVVLGDVKRYRLLDSLKRFAAPILRDSAAGGSVARAHADWFAQLAGRLDSEWVGPLQARALDRLVTDLPNLRLAIDACLSDASLTPLLLPLAVMPTAQLWWTAGHVDEGRYWLGRILQSVTEPGPLRVRALRNDATLALVKSDTVGAASIVAQAVALESALPESGRRAAADAFITSFHHTMSGDFAAAVDVVEAVLPSLAGQAVESSHLQLRQVLVYALAGLGDDAKGKAACEELLAISGAADEEYYRGFALQMLALHALVDDETERAAELIGQALTISAHFPNRPENPDALLTAALIAVGQGNPDRGQVLLGAAETTAQTLVALTRTFLNGHPKAHALQAHYVTLVSGEHSPRRAEGQAMTPHTAIAFALGRTRRSEPGEKIATHGVRLTPRESEVAELVARGLSDRQIAATLVISLRTAEGHVARILGKIARHDREDIASWLTAQPDPRRLGSQATSHALEQLRTSRRGHYRSG